MERRTPCSRCRQRVVVKVRSTSAEIVCPSCTYNVLPIPEDEYQTSQYQGFHSQIRSFGAHIKSKKHINSHPSINAAFGPSPTRSSKRALLCGLTYNDMKHNKLKGSINDVKNMRNLLITRFGYPKEHIRVLTEEETDQRFKPTRKNMEDSLRWLVDDCRSGDSLVFFYSGHGSREVDYNNDDQACAICPVDFQEAGKNGKKTFVYRVSTNIVQVMD